ncbi:MAG: hypothetical protein LBN06_12720 [Prevotellaceae bacterium]|jgi:K+-sensing histidine kinase KdpD|nr:hypothetical protein [Prevotellaceae bacterium]
MKQVTWYSVLAALAIIFLQAFWIYQMRQWYMTNFTAKADEEFGVAIEQEAGQRNRPIADPKNKWYMNKEVSQMTPEERARSKGDTLSLSALEQNGVAVSMSQLITQIMQDKNIEKSNPPLLYKVDSLFLLNMGDIQMPPHCIQFSRHDEVLDCFGDTTVVAQSGKVITLKKPIGTQGMYSMQLTLARPENAMITRMLYAIAASLVLSVLIVVVLSYQLWVIRRKNELLREREASINGIVHDLKSPLIGVTTLLGWLKGREKDAFTQELLKTGSERLKLMSQDIETLLVGARYGARNITLHKKPTDLPALLQMVIESLSLNFIQKPHHIEVINKLDHTETYIDADYMRSVLFNLLENALKYSDDGVEVTVTLEAPAGGKQVRITVADNGWGIRRRYRRKLFHSYFRVPQEKGRERQGHGIGLMYAGSIMRAAGGKVKVVSRENVGSTFTITFPNTPSI